MSGRGTALSTRGSKGGGATPFASRSVQHCVGWLMTPNRRWRWCLFDGRPYPRPPFSWSAWRRGVSDK